MLNSKKSEQKRLKMTDSIFMFPHFRNYEPDFIRGKSVSLKNRNNEESKKQILQSPVAENTNEEEKLYW